MFRFNRWLLCAALALASRMMAQPALTTIQDVLYTADGGRFNGLMIVSWKSFEAVDTSNIGSLTQRIQINNGSLYVQLVPTTNADSPASYTVQYNTNTGIRFTEVWVVPPSTTPLRVRDVRLAPGAVSTPGPAPSTSVQISDVVGLQSALNVRPTMGAGFAVSRVVLINSLGSLDGAVGNLSDCIHVDGTSGACGAGTSGTASFVDAEVPSGAFNGSNATFTLANSPNPAYSLALYRNGLLLKQTVDYTLSANAIAFVTAAIPQSGDSLLAAYRLSVSLPGVGFVDAESPSGSINGANALFTLSQTPNPAASLAVYRNGMRLRSGVDYTASSNSITFVTASVPQIGDILQCSYRISQ